MIRITVPATTSNFGSGFDTLGLALSPRARFEVFESSRYGILSSRHRRKLSMPYDESNIFITTYKRARAELGLNSLPITVDISTSFKMGSGLGSSATAVVGGIVAAYEVEGLDFKEHLREITELAVQIEGHPDNILPALLGGFVVGTTSPVRWSKLPFPFSRAVVVMPNGNISTKDSRGSLPRTIPLAAAVNNIQKTAMLITTLQEVNEKGLTGELKSKLREAVDGDMLHQRKRLEAIKGGVEAIEAAYDSGAAMAFLSGSGPSIIAFPCERVERVASEMKKAFATRGVDATYVIVEVSWEGVKVTHLSSPS